MRRQAIPLKKILLSALALMLAATLVSCGADEKKKTENTETVTTGIAFDTDVEGYDPYAIVDYDEPLVDAVSEGDVHIPKINVYLKGACTLSEKIMNDNKSCEKVSYECVVQYDTLQIIVKATDGGRESYRVYYYDALTDNELAMVDFISYCSVAYKDMYTAACESVGDDELDEDAVEYLVYRGENNYDLYIENSIYPVTIEKTEINADELIDAVGTENQG